MEARGEIEDGGRGLLDFWGRVLEGSGPRSLRAKWKILEVGGGGGVEGSSLERRREGQEWE